MNSRRMIVAVEIITLNLTSEKKGNNDITNLFQHNLDTSWPHIKLRIKWVNFTVQIHIDIVNIVVQAFATGEAKFQLFHLQTI